MSTPLYTSLLDICTKQIAADPEFLSSCRLDITQSPEANLLAAYRLFKLRRTIRLTAAKSRFYQRAFADAGISPDSVCSLEDLNKLPLTTPNDLAGEPFAFLCVSQRDVERTITFTSSGTVGPLKRVFFTPGDIESMTDFMAVGIKTVADETDVVQILLPEGPILGQCDLLARGVAKMGARAVISGIFSPPEEQVKTIRENHSTVLFGESHLIYRITKRMENTGNLSSLGVRTLFLTTSHATEGMKDYLSRTWHAKVSTHYGLTEMGLGLAVDCPACGGRHYNELDVIGEVVDPATGRPVPEGATGELVFTTLNREAMPLIRYRTHDLGSMLTPTGTCAGKLQILGPVKSRLDSHVTLPGGINLYPTLLHDTIFSHPEVIDYDLSLLGRGNETQLLIEVETACPDAVLSDSITKAVTARLGTEGCSSNVIRVTIAFRNPGALGQGAHFKKIVKDLRE